MKTKGPSQDIRSTWHLSGLEPNRVGDQVTQDFGEWETTWTLQRRCFLPYQDENRGRRPKIVTQLPGISHSLRCQAGSPRSPLKDDHHYLLPPIGRF